MSRDMNQSQSCSITILINKIDQSANVGQEFTGLVYISSQSPLIFTGQSTFLPLMIQLY